MTIEAAEQDLIRLVPSMANAYPGATSDLLQRSQLRPVVTPLKQEVIGAIGGTLSMLLTAAALVLFVACANVANLVLVRAAHRVLSAARALPGGEAASAVSSLPLAGTPFTSLSGTVETFADRPDPDQPAPSIAFRLVSPGYFQAMGIPIVAGRDVADGEQAGDIRPVLVSRAAARRLFGDRSPLGERIRRGRRDGRPARSWTTIVGIVGDVRDDALTSGPSAIVYVPLLASRVDDGYVPRGMTLVVRTGLPPMALVGQIREIVRGLDRDQPIANVRTMEDVVTRAGARTTFLAILRSRCARSSGASSERHHLGLVPGWMAPCRLASGHIGPANVGQAGIG